MSEIFIYIGAFLLMFSFTSLSFKIKKIPFKLNYDLFATGALLVWFSYWSAFFRLGSPLFEYYPLYFSFITALFTLLFRQKKEEMDPDSVMFLKWLSNSGRFNEYIIMIAVMVSLAMPGHFLFFPVCITLLVIRFTVACCLDE